VDALCVYLNGYEKIPKFLYHPKVLHAVLSSEAGWRGAEAKFWFWDQDEFKAVPQWKSDDVALICDDDIIYPPNYVEKMVECLDRHPKSVACVHGAILMEPFTDYAMDRYVARSVGGLAYDTQVHLPGTGTTAFRVGDLHVSLKQDFPWSHCVDPCIGMLCKKQNVEVWSVARPDKWLEALALPLSGTNIYRARVGAKNVSVETQLLNDAGPWVQLPHNIIGIVPKGQYNSPVIPAMLTMNPSSMLPTEAVAWLADNIPNKPGVIVELGSGHGTERILKMVQKGQRLVSVEHDKNWVGLIPGTQYVHAPIRAGWYDGRALRRGLPTSTHVIALIVDGPPGNIGRGGLFDNLHRFPEMVPMLLDDVNRPAELALAQKIAKKRNQPLQIHECAGGRAFATLGW
jgi:hypothetical protein